MTAFEDSSFADHTEALTLSDSHILGPDITANPFSSPPLDPLELIGLSVEQLHDKVTSEITVLDMLNRDIQRIIRTRLLTLFAEIATGAASQLLYQTVEWPQHTPRHNSASRCLRRASY